MYTPLKSWRHFYSWIDFMLLLFSSANYGHMVITITLWFRNTVISDSKSLNWPCSGKNSEFLALFWLVEGTLGIGWK